MSETNRAIEASEQAEAQYRTRQDIERRRISLQRYGHPGAHIPEAGIDSAEMRRLGLEAYEAALDEIEAAGTPLSDRQRLIDGMAELGFQVGVDSDGEDAIDQTLLEVKLLRDDPGELRDRRSNPCEPDEAESLEAELVRWEQLADERDRQVTMLTEAIRSAHKKLAKFDQKGAKQVTRAMMALEAVEPLLSNPCEAYEAGESEPEDVTSALGEPREASEPEEAELERLRAGMAELGYTIGRNPDGDDETVDATLLIVKKLQRLEAKWRRYQAALAEAKRALDV